MDSLNPVTTGVGVETALDFQLQVSDLGDGRYLIETDQNEDFQISVFDLSGRN